MQTEGAEGLAGMGPDHPASGAQESLWFLDQTVADPAISHVAFGLRLVGRLHRGALEESFRLSVRQHEILTTRFIWTESTGLRQRVQPGIPVPFDIQDLQDLKDAAQAERLAAAKTAFAHAPFDLAQGPLIRTRLFILGPELHVLALCIHHIVFDAWSYSVFLATWQEHYRSLCQGMAPVLPVSGPAFGEVTQRQQARLEGSHLQRLQNHWARHLTGAPACLTLPMDRTPEKGAGRIPLSVSPELTAALKTFAQSQKGTFFMALLTGFSLLLSRLSGQEDVVVGTPVAGRALKDTWNQVGYFVNTLALRTDLSGAPTLRELFARVRETSLQGMAHQDLPFDQVVRLLNPGRAKEHTPLFQAMLVLHNVPHREGAFLDLETFPEAIHPGATAFDLTLVWSDASGGLEYRADRFSEASATRMARQFVRILETLIQAPDLPIDQVSLLDAQEAEAERTRGRGETHPLPNESVHAAIVRQAMLRPDAIAAMHQGRALTYAQLEHLSRQVAAVLRSKGITEGTPVGLLMHPGLEQLVGQLGVLRAGGAYVPLDPEHPSDRIRQVLDASGAPWLLTHGSLVPRLAAIGKQALVLDLDMLAPLQAPITWEDVRSEDTACILFTSGSTGRPKGVMVKHRGLVNILTCLQDLLRVGPEDRTLGMTALGFDPSSMERLLPLRCGGRVELLDRAAVVNPLALKEAIARVSPTLLVGAPALWQLLQQADWRGDGRVKVLCGGETLQPAVAAYLLEQAGEVWNQYGPTEATILSTCHRVSAQDLPDIPIGTPVWNTGIQVLDARLQPVPPGVAGEICISGDGLAHGYLGLETETRARFPEDPAAPRLRLYRTGDLGRWNPDGTLAYLGRVDHQIKLRGYRIELEEVEAVLLRHAAVLQAAADVRRDAEGDHLVAFLVARPGQVLDPEVLRGHAKTALPPYMVPSQFFVLPQLPLRNGKVDRELLRATPLPRLTRTQERVDPRGPTEQMLLDIWRELLGRDDFGILDDFFELGGHSLLVMRLAARVEQVFGRRLAPAVLFERATIYNLGLALLESVEQKESASEVLQAGDPQKTIFYLHGDLPGLGLYCRGIVRHLDPAWTFTVIHPAGMGGQPPAADFDTMVTDHVALIRALQPVGPYRIAGFCNGASEALEIARRLSAQGETVARVALVAPDRPRTGPAVTGPREAALEGSTEALQVALASLIRAVASHVPQPYTGPVSVLLPDTPPPPEPALGWDRLLPDLDVRTIAGDHVTCLASPTLGTQLAEAFGAMRQVLS